MASMVPSMTQLAIAIGAVVTGAYLLAVLVNFAYLYPILAAKAIPYSSWLARMWFHSWI